MLDAATREELHELLGALVDLRLSEAQRARLAALLRERPEARDYYAAFTAVHVELHWRHTAAPDEAWLLSSSPPPPRTQLPPPMPRGKSQAAPNAPRPVPVAPLLGPTLRGMHWQRHPIAFLLTVSAVWSGLLLVLGMALLQLAEPEHAQETPPTQGTAVVARLVRSHEARWSGARGVLAEGTLLRAGERLKLAQGLALLVYESGAQVLLEGPASYVVGSPIGNTPAGEGRLEAGRLTARVPQSAYGFTIRSPSATVVDLGTEFGVEVLEDESTQVVVFDGAVQVASNTASPGDAGALAQLLQAGQAARVKNNGRAPARTRLTDADERFVRVLPQQSEEAELPALPVTRQLVLWLSAEAGVESDAHGAVRRWRDLTIGSNEEAHDAIQREPMHRPQWISHAAGGRPAVRFNGHSSRLVTPPISTGNAQTVVAVLALDETTSEWGQLLHASRPPYLLLEEHDPGVLQGRVHTYGERTQSAGSVASGALPRGTPIACAYIYDHPTNRAELWINGVPQGRTTAEDPAANDALRSIGSHPFDERFFRGDLSELLIYNTALSEQELEALHDYLEARYQLY